MLILRESKNMSIDLNIKCFQKISPVADALKLTDWIFAFIFIICLIYIALYIYRLYCTMYKSPKKQSKWLEDRFIEGEEK